MEGSGTIFQPGVFREKISEGVYECTALRPGDRISIGSGGSGELSVFSFWRNEKILTLDRKNTEGRWSGTSFCITLTVPFKSSGGIIELMSGILGLPIEEVTSLPGYDNRQFVINPAS